ncbi:MAG: redoxin domain-containing protein [Gammaproteobacteria bacterium]|nr:redoxin domain-containing protein [Gammaproteobacteria bacterium]
MTKIFSFSILCLFFYGASAAQFKQSLSPVASRPVAPDFTLEDMDGNAYKLSDYRGKKVVLINFWATWCPPCRREMPSMQRAWEQVREENILLLAINVGEDEGAVFEFTANYPVDFPILFDMDSKVLGQWPVMGLPTTLAIDAQGRIAYRAVGGREWDDPELLAPLRALTGAIRKFPISSNTQQAKSEENGRIP